MYGPMHPMMGQGWEQMWRWMGPMPMFGAFVIVAVMTVALALAVFGVVVAVRRDRGGAGKPA